MNEDCNEELRERILVHGPCLKNLTELLCFDRIVYPPLTMAFKRPPLLPRRTLGYPADEPLSQAIRDQLAQAGFTVASGTLLLEGDFPSQQDAMERAEAVGEMLGGMMFPCVLDTPATAAEKIAWLQGIDANTKALADLAVKHGKRAVAKFYAEDVTRCLMPGWNLALSFMFRLPKIQLDQSYIGTLMAFLADEGTRQRRHQLFDCIEGGEIAVENGTVKVEAIPNRLAALIEDYSHWIRSSGLSSGSTRVEFLFSFGQPFIEQLVAVAVPKEVNQILTLRPRGLALTEGERAVSGRQLAYITHAKRDYDYTNAHLPSWMKAERQGW